MILGLHSNLLPTNLKATTVIMVCNLARATAFIYLFFSTAKTKVYSLPALTSLTGLHGCRSAARAWSGSGRLCLSAYQPMRPSLIGLQPCLTKVAGQAAQQLSAVSFGCDALCAGIALMALAHAVQGCCSAQPTYSFAFQLRTICAPN